MLSSSSISLAKMAGAAGRLVVASGTRVLKTALGISYARSRPKNTDPKAPILLFTHATGFVKEMWKPVLDDKLLRHVEWVAMDHAGHGSSRAMPDSGTWEDWTQADIGSVLDDLKLDQGRPVVAIGHSMGGAAIANYEVANPGTWAHALLIEPPLFSLRQTIAGNAATLARTLFGVEMNFLVAMQKKRKAAWPSAVEARASMRKAFPRFDEAVLTAWQAGALKPAASGRGAVELRLHPLDEGKFYAVVGQPMTRRRFQSARCTFTVAAGAQSTFGFAGHVGASYYESMVAPQLGARFVRVEDSGHFCVMERPAAVAQMIAEDLAERGLL